MEAVKMEYNLMMKKIYDEKLTEKGYQTLQIGSCKILCPLTGIVRYWPYGQEVFITNLPAHMTEYEMFTWFCQFGTIQQIRLPIRQNGESKTYAFVLYKSREEAMKAVKIGDNMVFKYLRGSWRIQIKLSLDNRRIFVKNFPQNWSSFEVERLVSASCPGFKRVVLFKKHYCFIEFRSHFYAAFAKTLLKNILRKAVGDNTITVNWAYPEPVVDPQIMQKVKTLFIRGLTWETNQIDVSSVIHELLRLDWSSFHVRKEKDYAFVEFSSKEQAERAKSLLEGASVLGEKISVSWARPNDPRAWVIPGGLDAPNPLQCVAPAPVLTTTGCSPMDGAGETPVGARGGQTGWDYQSASIPEEITRCLRRSDQNEIPFWNEKSEQLQVEPPLAVSYTAKYNWYNWSDGVDRVSGFASDTSMPSILSCQDLQFQTLFQKEQITSQPHATVGMGFPDFSKWTGSTDAK